MQGIIINYFYIVIVIIDTNYYYYYLSMQDMVEDALLMFPLHPGNGQVCEGTYGLARHAPNYFGGLLDFLSHHTSYIIHHR